LVELLLLTVQETVTLVPEAVAVTTGVGSMYIARGEAEDSLEEEAPFGFAASDGWLDGAELLPMTTAVALEELGTKGARSRVMASSMSKVAAESTEIFEVKVPFVPLVTGNVTDARIQVGPTLNDLFTDDAPSWLRVSVTVEVLLVADFIHTLKLRAVVVGVTVSSTLSEPEDFAVIRSEPWPL